MLNFDQLFAAQEDPATDYESRATPRRRGLMAMTALEARASAADAALVASLLLLLCASTLCFVCARRTQRKRRYVARERGFFVKDMEEPLLGPPEYEQPPAREAPPPAYEYLPSAPPLSP